MSMHKLTAGDGYAYLTRHVAAGDVDLQHGGSLTAYYEQIGNPAGRWHGTGLARLGQDAVNRVVPGERVTEEAMAAVFRDGIDPVTGAPLGRPYNHYTATAQAEPGARSAGPRHAVVGYDLTFTAPKSVSVLWGLADDRTRAVVYAAHRDALTEALAVVEQRVIRTRVGDAGCRQVRTQGMIAAIFDHWDTRAGDPNLHTHVVVANKVQGADGGWRSVDGKTVHAATITVSELYDTLLADELARRLPVQWSRRDRGPRRNPAFEVDGIADDVLAHFSARSEQIHCAEQDWAADFVATHGREPTRLQITRARQHLARATRPPKSVRPLADLLAEWANRARALTGMEPRDLAARALRSDYGRTLNAHDVGPEVKAAMVAQMLSDVSTKRSVWNTWNLAAEALRSSKPLRMASPTERRALLNSLVTEATGSCVHLDDTRDPASRRVGESLYTSAELLAAEKVLLDANETDMPALRDERHRRMLVGRLPSYLAGLAPDQAAAVEAVIASGHTLDTVVGPAGSGKTTTLGALTSFWQRNVGPVIGLGPSATAGHTLGQALGVDCETTAKWLYKTSGDGARRRAHRLAELQLDVAGGDYSTASVARRTQWDVVGEQRRWSFAPGQLVVVDEASLADTRALADLTLQAGAAGAKVLLVGDHLQRGSVDAGGAFAMLARRGPAAELTSLWRFAHPWEARASLELRHGRPSALDAYDAHGAFSAGAHDAMVDQALDAVASARDQGRTAVLQAADNRTVRELNTRAHADGVLAGTVSREGLVLHDGLTAGVGDRIVTRHNQRRLATTRGYVRNGDLWDVTAIHPDGSVRARPADMSTTATVRLPAAYVAEHVELGYATSTARSQGITADETHTIAAPGMAREDLYVGMSRGRQHNHTYVALDQPDPDCLPGHGAPANAREVLDQILATTHTERSATETWETFHPETAPPSAVRIPMYGPTNAGRRSAPPPIQAGTPGGAVISI